MSRQVTLFGSWAKDSTDERTKGEAPSTSTGNQQAYNYDDIQLDSLDDFFEDDVAEEIQTIQDNKDNLDKSSLYEEIPGFDLKAGETFIYPTNYPTRDYQFNIVKKCLYRNTLVSLPTGLGKTFIAAVVMYNFYRWYPTKKIVFMAPTKPLVSQQIEACYNIMGISQGHSAEMTGAMLPKERVTQWQIKRVFYLTPQVFQNDLGRGTCPATDVCCVIFDEAHKALGNHAYCQAVQQIIDNLMIAHVEVRSEESLDVQQFTHQRKVEIIVVDLKGDIMDIVISFKKVLAGVIGRLASEKMIYTTDIDRLSKFQLLQARQKFRDTTAKGVMSGAIEGDFALAISLLHGYELLLQHGMRSFYVFLDQNVNNNERKSRALVELLRNPTFREIMSTLHDKVIGSKDVTENSLLQLNSSMYCPLLKREGRFFYSHPKLNKLEAVVVSFFNSNNADSKVMIFSQYRESVCEIADMLSYHAPLVRVMCFIGHSSTTGKASKGQTHKEQIEVVHKFRQGGYNVLVSTCVGEEGLDIGEVDMIVCFDAHKSPVRLVQRMGRTGRKREGKIVVIVSKGKEEQTYHKSQSNRRSINKAIQENSKSLNLHHMTNPRMIPHHLHPKVDWQFIEVAKFTPTNSNFKSLSKPTQSIKCSLAKAGNSKGAFLTDAELKYWHCNFALPDDEMDLIEKSIVKCASHMPLVQLGEGGSERGSGDGLGLSLTRWNHLQLAPASSNRTSHHSSSWETFRSVLKFSDDMTTDGDLLNSYDLEMRTFLDKDDMVKPSKGKGKLKSNKRKLQPDNENLQQPKSKFPLASLQNNKTKLFLPNDKASNETTNDKVNEELATVGMEVSSSKRPSVNEDISILNCTQSAVPCPPNVESLDWMDVFMSTQKFDTSMIDSTTSDVLKIQTELEHQHESPQYQIESPQHQHESPQYQIESPQHQHESPQYQIESQQHQHESPQYQIESPQHQHESPQYQIESPQYQIESPQYQIKSPQHQHESPQYQIESPQHQHESPQYQIESPQHQHESPQYQIESPQHQHESPQYQIESQQHQHESPQYQIESPQHQHESPQYQIESQQHQHESPQYQIESPQHQHESPQYQIESPRHQHESPQYQIESPSFDDGYSYLDDISPSQLDYDDNITSPLPPNDETTTQHHQPESNEDDKYTDNLDDIPSFILFGNDFDNTANDIPLDDEEPSVIPESPTFLPVKTSLTCISSVTPKKSCHSVELINTPINAPRPCPSTPVINNMPCINNGFRPLATPDSEDNFLRKRPVNRKRMRDLLSSQSPVDRNNKLKPMTKCAKPNTNTLLCDNFIDIEAIDEDSFGNDDNCEVMEDHLDDYDFSDSFINDNSVLTQHVTPSHHHHHHLPSKKATTTVADMGNIYRQSLLSPNNRFNKVNGYKLILSPRHVILNDCMTKIGNGTCYDNKDTNEMSDVALLRDDQHQSLHEDVVSSTNVSDYDYLQRQKEEISRLICKNTIVSPSLIDNWMETTSVESDDELESIMAEIDETAIMLQHSPCKESSNSHLNMSDNLNVIELSSNELEKQQLTILVDSRELATQVVPSLRYKHNINVCIGSVGCVSGYVVSLRTVIIRKLQSDLFSFVSKCLPQLQSMEKLYEKVFLLVEKDQEINNGKMKFHSNTTSIDSSLSCITAKTNIGVLYSQSPESTASLIVDNALMEAGKGFKICPSLPNLLETAEEKVKLLLKVPCVNIVLALNLLSAFPNLSTIMNCSCLELKSKVCCITTSQAQAVFDFFHKNFNPDLYILSS